MRTRAVVTILVCSWLGGCDGGGAGVDSRGGDAASIGPVDLTKAPATLEMTCGGGIGTVTIEQPCLVGFNLAGDQFAPGLHATECRLASSDRQLVWTFLLPLVQIARDPSTALHLPGKAATVNDGEVPVAIGAEQATVSRVTGDLSFSRVDPDVRAFAGTLDATVTWKTASGAQIDCTVDGPFWGAPGLFE
ncbi:MAG TPA: hypothetical protein VG871_19690 [Vicinamibacterales bacterium]|jgi:hypothetical protein|nr:hypothetical protein [Vicinamibacterales bacterium]